MRNTTGACRSTACYQGEDSKDGTGGCAETPLCSLILPQGETLQCRRNMSLEQDGAALNAKLLRP